MDVLQPELVWVEGRCYRFYDKLSWSHGHELESYEEETYEPDCESNDEELCDTPIEIVEIKGNRYKHSFHVNSNFYKFIIGSKGATLKRLVAETKTFIYIPQFGQDGDIAIIGSHRRDVMAARNRIDILIETSRSKLAYTHFLSIPVISDEIEKNFIKLKEDILKVYGCATRGIKEELFTTKEKLHLTLCMLTLLDEEDRKKAVQALDTCRKDIIIPALEKSGLIKITLKGIECFNDDPSEVNVLYIKVSDETNYLQRISDDIADYFINQGLARRQNYRVKLHLTVMNVSNLLDKNEPQENYRKKKETFDATEILKKYENYYLGKTILSTIHLSQLHSKSEDGYYEASSKIAF